MSGQEEQSTRAWTILGLAIALCGLPLVVEFFRHVVGPRTPQNTVARELIILALVAVLFWIIRRKEKLGWNSVGLGRAKPGSTALWVLIAILASAVAIAISFGIIHVLGLHFGSPDPRGLDTLPTWVLVLVIVRAGLAEEVFYRGYAIERLQSLTASRWVAIVVPLLIFAIFHYRQGAGGVVIALLTGAVMTGVYLRTRNLWVCIITHFLIDFIPNVVLPVFMRD
jgi:membrane protease YdiL (CAAX protease family)